VHTTPFWNNLHQVRSKLINVREYQAIESGQSKETGNIGYTRRRRTRQKHNTICVGQMIGNPNKLLAGIPKIYGHLCLREGILNYYNNYIT
jgi:hypothetical protein